jgi:uncharacterized membrane protein SpoIIM required for sporulation
MTQEEFVRKNEKIWEQFSTMLTNLKKPKNKREHIDLKEFPVLFRKICHHLELAKNRLYGSHLIEYLNSLSLGGHQLLYDAKKNHLTKFLELFRNDFPAAVRQNGNLFLISGLIFFVPLIFIFIIINIYPEVVYSIISIEFVKQMESMYDPQKDRTMDIFNNFTMFGFYIWNNIGIGFRTFAGGLLFGAGSIFFLFYNGLLIGTITGHLYVNEMGHVIFPFIVGHSSFELLAIVISGMAGLKMGLSIIKPGRFTRMEALRKSGSDNLPLIYGFMSMFFMAALIEAFWSSSRLIANGSKYLTGSLLWVLIFFYFAFAGRDKK